MKYSAWILRGQRVGDPSAPRKSGGKLTIFLGTLILARAFPSLSRPAKSESVELMGSITSNLA
ncbi:hypothetical protein PtB15_8B300 [Puccinia triticina]|nr:hypothetical protein PtB15_8B300 [Puccinia triticina]